MYIYKPSCIYIDNSVLENYHISEAFKIINNYKDCNIFSILSSNEYKLIRKKIINTVLATDMTLHFKEYHCLKLKRQFYNIKEGKNSDMIISSLKDNNEKEQTKQEIINNLMHLADISNPAKPLNVYKIWAELVMNEFWLQGDIEKSLDLSYSMLCDRQTNTIPASQVGFMQGIVLPLTEIVVDIFPGLNYMICNINNNLEYYKSLKSVEDKKKESQK